MTATDYLEANVLNYLTNSLNLGAITSYIGLFTVAPTDSTPGTEASYGGYARQPAAAAFPNATTGTLINDVAVVYPTSAGPLNTIVAVGLFDASTAGNLLVYQALAVSIAINSAETPRFSVGSIIMNMD